MTSASRFPKRAYQPQTRQRDLPPEERRSRQDQRPARSAPYAPAPASPAAPAAGTAWESQAAWYDQLVGEDGDDFYRHLILPAVLRRLGAKAGETVLDIGCGQGVLGRVLAAQQVKTLGVDASPGLLEAAGRRAGPLERRVLGDARELAKAVAGELCDHAAAVLSLQDLDPLPPVLTGAAAHVRPGGRLVVVLTHPCFRVPKRSGWGWDDEQGMQYRRMDGYLRPLAVPILTHPGLADPSRTLSFHRPLGDYLEALGQAGFGVTGCDELCSHRRGSRGARSAAEDRALSEFPLFLVLTAVRLGSPVARVAAPAPVQVAVPAKPATVRPIPAPTAPARAKPWAPPTAPAATARDQERSGADRPVFQLPPRPASKVGTWNAPSVPPSTSPADTRVDRRPATPAVSTKPGDSTKPQVAPPAGSKSGATAPERSAKATGPAAPAKAPVNAKPVKPAKPAKAPAPPEPEDDVAELLQDLTDDEGFDLRDEGPEIITPDHILAPPRRSAAPPEEPRGNRRSRR